VSASQRRKGANGENELARILSDHFGRVVKRTLGQARDGGHDIETPPFRWEVKRRKAIAVYDFIEQAAEACQDGATPVVAMRADGKGWLVLMRLEDALPLIRGELTPMTTTETDYPPQEVVR
jgi:Holliday junction resolvase